MIYGAILTDRNKVGPSTIKDSLKSIKKGKILGIFPEGGITSTVQFFQMLSLEQYLLQVRQIKKYYQFQ